MCGGVRPTDENSEKKGRGEVLAACCLGVVVSWCLRDEVNVVGGVLVALEQFFDGGIGRHVEIISKDER